MTTDEEDDPTPKYDPTPKWTHWKFIGPVIWFFLLNLFMSICDMGTDIWTGIDLIR